MSCSINKLKSQMLFTCKTFMFSDFMFSGPPPPQFPLPVQSPFLYGPAYASDQLRSIIDKYYNLQGQSVGCNVFISDLKT